jgi:mono/diheme cytochrome c family protein
VHLDGVLYCGILEEDSSMRCPRFLVTLVTGLPLASVGVAQDGTTTKVASAEEYEGWRQYMVACARCHGDDAVGGVMAPDLRTAISKGMSAATFSEVVTTGRRDKGMPGFQETLTPDQVGALHAYVRARADQRLPAGRPERGGG